MHRSRKWNATLENGAARARSAGAQRKRAASREVKQVLQQVFDLPRRAEFLR
jgi:hypothetical protein